MTDTESHSPLTGIFLFPGLRQDHSGHSGSVGGHSPLTGIFLFPGCVSEALNEFKCQSLSPDGDFFVSGNKKWSEVIG